MKIAVWILSDYKHQIGGGFALYDKFIQLIDLYEFSPGIEVCFVGHNSPGKYNFKKNYLQLDFFSSVAASKYNAKKKVGSSIFGLQKLFARYSHRIGFLNKHERAILDGNDIDLIFYPVQGFKKIVDFPFVSSNWDIGHKASYAFPELGMNYSFDYREKWYRSGIFKALFVFAESQSGKEELIKYTGLNPDRVKIIPLFPGGVVDLHVEEAVLSDKLTKLGLNKGKYFFYPAQFWAHKNHYNLLLAFQLLYKENPEIKLVLTGSDKGNKSYIQETANTLGLKNSVLFTGFIENLTMVALYKNATAMVMPSFLGPTNMPLLEARLLSCPVLCSDLPGHKEIMENGAFYFDPSDHLEIFNSMKKVLQTDERTELLANAGKTISTTNFSKESVMKKLDENFLKLIPIRKTWGKSHKIF